MRLKPTSGITPGRIGAFAATRTMSAQVRCSTTSTGTKALRLAISFSARSRRSGGIATIRPSRSSTASTSPACSRTMVIR